MGLGKIAWENVIWMEIARDRCPMTGVPFPAVAVKGFSSFHCRVQTSSGAHISSFPIGTEDFFSGG
jgi:phosphoribosylcarboxyaminoimidazole (NCAIR) mutase